jgi:hypothetical protein
VTGTPDATPARPSIGAPVRPSTSTSSAARAPSRRHAVGSSARRPGRAHAPRRRARSGHRTRRMPYRCRSRPTASPTPRRQAGPCSTARRSVVPWPSAPRGRQSYRVTGAGGQGRLRTRWHSRCSSQSHGHEAQDLQSPTVVRLQARFRPARGVEGAERHLLRQAHGIGPVQGDGRAGPVVSRGSTPEGDDEGEVRLRRQGRPPSGLTASLAAGGRTGPVASGVGYRRRSQLPEDAEPLGLDAEGRVELAAVVGAVRNPRELRVARSHIAADRCTGRNPGATSAPPALPYPVAARRPPRGRPGSIVPRLYENMIGRTGPRSPPRIGPGVASIPRGGQSGSITGLPSGNPGPLRRAAERRRRMPPAGRSFAALC